MDEFKEQTQPNHPFLPYAQEYWLFHTKEYMPARIMGVDLWYSLIDGADINTSGKNFGTALQVASVAGHEKIARLILKNGDMNASGGKYGAAL